MEEFRMETNTATETPLVTTLEKVKGVVMPERPKFDRMVAAWLLMSAKGLGPSKDTVEFRESEHPIESTWQRWADEGKMVIGVNVHDGRALGEQSAAVAMYKWLRTVDLGLQRLAGQANDENRQATMRGLRGVSVPYLIIEMDKSGYSRLAIMQATFAVIKARWLAKSDMPIPESPGLTTLLEQIGGEERRQCSPFTLGQYAINLAKLGEPMTEIEAAVGFWLKGRDKVKADIRVLPQKWDEAQKADGQVEFLGNGAGVFLRSDDERLGGWVRMNAVNPSGRKGFDVVIAKRPRGNIAVFSEGGVQYSLQAFAAAVVLLEGEAHSDPRGKWHYRQAAPNICINGSPGHSLPPTALTDDDVTKLVNITFGYGNGSKKSETYVLAYDLAGRFGLEEDKKEQLKLVLAANLGTIRSVLF
jgi:hypothetical protein